MILSPPTQPDVACIAKFIFETPHPVIIDSANISVELNLHVTMINQSACELTHTARLSRFENASTRLALMSNTQMQSWLDGFPTTYSGIGGTATALDINGIKVFAKRVSLTNLEMESQNLMNTGNIFRLPPSFHYGILSLGFGAWRELASHTMTSNWVLSQRCESFPLLHHWRILQNQKPREPTAELKIELSNLLKYWNNSESVASIALRLEELEAATTHLVLFLEHIPANLFSWLNQQSLVSEDAISAACSMVERNLRKDVQFMSDGGFLHLDAHSKNILTDGQRLFFTDFGLSLSTEFELSADERMFAEQNKLHDISHTIAALINWLVTNCGGKDVVDISSRNRLIASCASGEKLEFESVAATTIVNRYAKVAALFNEFHGALFQGLTETPFPTELLQEAWSESGLG